MKIGIDIRPLLLSKYSGVSEYTRNICQELFEQNPGNEFVLFYNAKKHLHSNIPDFEGDNFIIKKTNFPNKLFNSLMGLFGWPYLDKLANKSELYWLPNIDFCSISPQTPYIVTVHDLSFERFPEFFDMKHRLWYHLSNPKRVCQQAAHLIAVSESTKHDLMEIYGIEEKKITVIYEGVSPIYSEILSLDKLSSVKIKYNLPDKFVLFVGTIEPRKNIQSLIETLGHLPSDVRLVIIGKKGWKYQPILAVAEKYKNQIQFLDYVEAEDKPALYQSATLFAWPSFYEGFGLPPLEAQASGCPVIVGAHSSLAEVIQNSGMLVDVDDVSSLVRAINLLWCDDSLREFFRQKGLENAKKFSWSKAGQETSELFKLFK